MIWTLALRIVTAGVIALLVAGFIGLQSHGADAATLKRQVTVDGAVVTLGDLFDGAGALADKPVFRSPEFGVNGALPAGTALAAAHTAGLAVSVRPDFSTVNVVRNGRTIASDELVALIAQAAGAKLGVARDNVTVTIEGDIGAVYADTRSGQPVLLADLTLQQTSGRFNAVFSIDTGASLRALAVKGRAVETASVPVLTRALARRDIISRNDVTMTRVERRLLPANVALEADQLVEMAARRSLRAGDPINVSDVELPRLVERGEIVTIVLRKPGLTLSARGRALADGARGSLITVLNEQSRRTIQAMVSGAGTVEVSTSSPAVVLATN